ncbi:MAG: M24 family metallopeptidase [Chloroflexi bacterium]|nr:M24 family metallopeptidase [Chloroflexota bacterium]
MTTVSPAPPGLSFDVRDRHWAVTRELMSERNLDCLLVAGFRARERYESFLSDDYIEGCVVFPRDGEPVALTWTNMRVLRAFDSAKRGNELWVPDYRVAPDGAAAAAVVREKGAAAGRIGVVGLQSVAPTEMHGSIPANWWRQFSGALPEATFEEISVPFSDLMLVKTDAELALIRYAAEAAEAACAVMRDVTEVGVGEEVIFAEVVREVIRHGMHLRYPEIVMNSGPHTLAWGPPRWTTRAEPPRRLARGDIVCAEIMPTYGNQEVQVQMSVALDPIDATNQKCEAVSRESYEVALRVLKPGLGFADLVNEMAQPLRVAGCWAYTPLVHSVSPHFLLGRTPVNQENLDLGVRYVGPAGDQRPVRNVPLQAGMVLALEPNACLGNHRVNIGGTVIVTQTGCDELNVMPTRLTHK